jgi:diacylglycerol kinase family enzyme
VSALPVAVVLNKNARGVTTRQIRRIERMHGAADVFLSQSMEHGRKIAEMLVERGYGTVLLGGGDGTFVCCLNALLAASLRTGRPLPRLGVLRLGTGNALGYYLGVEPASLRGLRSELARARLSGASEHELPLLLVDGVLTPFAGTGLDSQILEDYAATTRTLDLLRLGPLLGSPMRYALAVALRSVPRFILRRVPHVEVINVGGPAYAIGPSGQPEPVALPRGTVLYRGPCSLAGAATVPCYGFGVRIFPFADLRRDKFHVRCTDASAMQTLANLPGVLRGTYRSPSLRDFLCDAVEIHMQTPVPMQLGGDLLKERRDFMRIELAPRRVRMLGTPTTNLPA